MGLDFDGIHDLTWESADGPGAVDVPRSTLERWRAEREAFRVAYLRWRRVAEEVEEALFRDEQRRGQVAKPEPALAVVAAPARRR